MSTEDKLIFEQKCRTCMQRQGEHNIYDASNYIRIELLFLTNLEIRMYDKLPVSICDFCLRDLRSACAFKKRCQESYFALIEEYESHNYKGDDLNLNNIRIKRESENLINDVIHHPSSPQIKVEEDQCSNFSDEQEDLSALLEPQIIVQEQTLSFDSKPSDSCNEESILNLKCEKPDEEFIKPDVYKLPKDKSKKSPKKRKPNENYECSICGKNFVRASNLKAHMPLHTGVRNFPCTECDKAYATLDHLKRHRKMHENENLQDSPLIKSDETSISKKNTKKIHKCLQCDRNFHRAQHLKRHISSCHKVQLEFKCTMCEKSFALESHLKIHLQLHSGEKSHKCDICGLIFRSTPSLESHKLNHVVALPGYQFANQI